MSSLAPLGPVYQAGTLSGNPLATAAGTTVLNLVTPRDYEDLARRVETLRVEPGVGDRLERTRRPLSDARVR